MSFDGSMIEKVLLFFMLSAAMGIVIIAVTMFGFPTWKRDCVKGRICISGSAVYARSRLHVAPAGGDTDFSGGIHFGAPEPQKPAAVVSHNLPGHSMKKPPSCLVIGATSAGTHALMTFLSLHDILAVSTSKYDYFAKYYTKGENWYMDQLPQAQWGQLIVDKSLCYQSSFAPVRVRHCNPAMKIVLVVRDPVERALSRLGRLRINNTKLTESADDIFIKLLSSNDIDLQSDTDISISRELLSGGLYFDHLENWFKFFPRSQIHVVDGDRLKIDPLPELKKMEDFLRLPQEYKESHFRRNNKTGYSCARYQNGELLCPPVFSQHKSPETINDTTRRKLGQYYKDANIKLFTFIGRTFNWNKLIDSSKTNTDKYTEQHENSKTAFNIQKAGFSGNVSVLSSNRTYRYKMDRTIPPATFKKVTRPGYKSGKDEVRTYGDSLPKAPYMKSNNDEFNRFGLRFPGKGQGSRFEIPYQGHENDIGHIGESVNKPIVLPELPKRPRILRLWPDHPRGLPKRTPANQNETEVKSASNMKRQSKKG